MGECCRTCCGLCEISKRALIEGCDPSEGNVTSRYRRPWTCSSARWSTHTCAVSGSTPSRHRRRHSFRLHRRHAERVPCETLWIHGGERWGIDPAEAAKRISMQGRGGYCYHVNGAFALLLHTLGYGVALHTGAVHGPAGMQPDEYGNHLVITVNGLTTDDNPDGDWYVDVGLGDALHEPLPLRPVTLRQGPFQIELQRTLGSAEGDWRFLHDKAGGFSGMAWRTGPPNEGLLVRRHEWLSTSPESGFVKLGLAQTRDATGVDGVHGLVVKRIGNNANAGVVLEDRKAWFSALADLFGLTFEASPPGTTDRLWENMLSAHRKWQAA